MEIQRRIHNFMGVLCAKVPKPKMIASRIIISVSICTYREDISRVSMIILREQNLRTMNKIYTYLLWYTV